MKLDETLTNIGEVLRRVLVIDQKQIETAVEVQRETPSKPLGQVMIELGMVSKEQVDNALSLQARLRKPLTNPVTADAAAEMLAQALDRNTAQARAVVALAASVEELAVPAPAPDASAVDASAEPPAEPKPDP